MEKKSLYLDTLSRRRALVFLLQMPPALLGLDVLTADGSKPVIFGPVSLPNLAAIQATQKNLWVGSIGPREQVAVTQAALATVGSALPRVAVAERPAWLEQQSLLWQGLVNVTREYAQPDLVMSYAQKSVQVAALAGNADLLAVARLRQISTAYLLRRDELALKLAQEFIYGPVNPAWLAPAGVPIRLARVLALSSSDQADRSQVLALIDEDRWSFDDAVYDCYHLRSDLDTCLIQSAQTLFNLASDAPDSSRLLGRANALLARVDIEAISSAPLRLLSLRLIQARIALVKRIYDQAAVLVLESFALMKQGHSTLDLPRLVEIYQVLQKSTYGAAPVVARLGLLLFEAGAL